MNIIDFVPYYRPHIGGLEKFAEELHERFVEKGDRVIIFAPDLPQSTLVENEGSLTIIRYPAFEIIPNYPLPKFWQKSCQEQFRRLAKEPCDVVISTSRFFFLSVIAHIWAKRHHKKRLHIEHGSDYVTSTPVITFLAYVYDKTFGAFVLKYANAVVAASVSAARFVKKLSRREVPVIYRGMSYEHIESIPINQNIRNTYAPKKIITYLGRLIHGKGVAVLLNAVSKMKQDDFILLIAGDGPERERLEAQTHELNLSARVIFLGAKPFDEAMGILKASDIFINPSFNEGLPTSVLEAAACNVAIVATNVGGTPEIVQHQQSAILIPPNNSNAIRSALEIVLKDKALRHTLVQAANKRIRQYFTWEKNVAAYRSILRKLSS